jgi:hypothetical protein
MISMEARTLRFKKQWKIGSDLGKVIDHVLGSLGIEDPFVELVSTLGFIVSSKNPQPACGKDDCKPNKVWSGNTARSGSRRLF